jgi:hypothetical protein
LIFAGGVTGATGGIINSAMFARLLLAELLVADLTLTNAKELERITLTGCWALEKL